MTRLHRVVPFGLMLIPVGPASAQTAPAPDLLVISVQVDDLAPGSGGGGASVEWLRRLPWGSMTMGASAFRLGDATWGVAKLAASGPIGDRLTLSGSVQAGPGVQAGNDFVYYRVTAGAAVRAGARAIPELQAQYFEVDLSHTTILQPGLHVQWLPRLSTRVAYGRSLGGTYDTEYAMGRADYAFRTVAVLVGGTVGRAAPDLFALFGTGGVVTGSRYEVFGGVTLPTRAIDLTVLLNWSDHAGQRRSTITMISRLPIR